MISHITKWHGHTNKLLVIPAFFFVFSFLAVPLGFIVRYSFDLYDPIELVKGVFTVETYLLIFTDSFYQSVLLKTIIIATVSTVLTLLLSFPVAYFISRLRSARLRGILVIVTILPLLLGNAVRMAAWMVTLNTNGLVNSLLLKLGIVTHSVQLLYNSSAVVVALVSVLLPFAIVIILNAIDAIPYDLEGAAQSAGARPWQAVILIVLPLATPGIVAAATICFALSMNAYATPVLVGGPKFNMLGPSIYNQINVVSNWPVGSALACVLILVTSALTVLSTYFIVRRTYY